MHASRIYRLLRLITLLQSGRAHGVRQLMEELSVSRRTLFRDLNMLELARVPYYYDADRGGYRIAGNFFLPPVNLTLGEALSMLALTRLREVRQLPLLGEAAKAALKLESALPTAIRQHVGGVVDKMSISFGPVARQHGLDGMMADLSGAIASRHVCRMTYISFDEKKQLQTNIHPLRLVFNNRAWYLLAWAEQWGAVRTFKLSRMKRLDVTNECFDQPAFDEAKYFGRAWAMIPEGRIYKVHLRFAPKVAGNVAEVQWHPSQSVTWGDDGSIDFHVSVDGLGEIFWWILGYGDQVEVVSPAPLRKRLTQVAQSMHECYSGGNA